MKVFPIAAAVSLAILGLLGFSSTGANALVYDLTIDHCTGGCSTGGVTPFGSVTITQTGSAGAYTDTFTVQMTNPTYVFNGNGNGFDAFAFSLAAPAGQTVSLLSAMTSAGFGIDTTLPQKMDGFGFFNYGITLTNAGTGANQLVFTVTDTNLLSTANFLLGTGNTPAFFAADILSTNGATGPVGAAGVAATPLPPTWTMLLIGLAGFGFVAYRRNSKPALMTA